MTQDAQYEVWWWRELPHFPHWVGGGLTRFRVEIDLWVLVNYVAV